MEEIEEKSLMLTKNFTNLMDNIEEWSAHDISEDAILDWFGRSVFGRSAIINFIKTNVPKTHHTIMSIARIPPINHRYLKRFESIAPPPKVPVKMLVEECGQGDCWGKTTPDNKFCPNLEELVRAPRKRRCQRLHVTEHWQFIEIKGRLEFEQISDNGVDQGFDKRIKRIVLGYTDQIHIIVYEAKNGCKKKLSSLFNIADE